MFSPESTEDAEGNQEHHQGGAIAHRVHDLQLQQVLVLQKEACVSPTCPPGWLCPFLPQSVLASGYSNPLNLGCYAVHTPETSVHRLVTSWLWKRFQGLSDANSSFSPIYKASYITLNLSCCLNTTRDKVLIAFQGIHSVYSSAKYDKIFSHVKLKSIIFIFFLIFFYYLLIYMFGAFYFWNHLK